MKSGQKYTYGSVKQIIENDGHILLSETYVNSKTNIKIKCGDCGHEYDVIFKSYMRGSRCIKCAQLKSAISRRTTEEEVKALMKEKGDTLIKLFFVKSRARVEFQCGKCEKTFTLVYFTYQKRKGCKCIKKEKINIDYCYVKEYVAERGEILISTDYIDSTSPLQIKCCKCNEIYTTIWSSYNNGSRCNLCSIYKKKTIDDCRQLIESDNNNKLITTEYKNNFSKIDVKCGSCDKIFSTSYMQYKQGKRCLPCSIKIRTDKNRHSQEYVADYIKSNRDTLLSTYINMDTNIDIQCGICNNIFNVTFSSYKTSFTRCPCITKSKGERLVEEYLDSKNISYETQKTFPDCKMKIALRYDFYLPDYDILIEFDGSIHFKPNALLGGMEAFNNRRKSDIIKNKYCIKNNKKLLRISYNYIRTVGKIIDNYLNKSNKRLIEYSSLKTYANLIIETNETLIKESYINNKKL